ncbi:hypothetical protein SAMN04489712_10429 [Thermomonospora echinospora]|uniref:DUF8129 domain-containing protein n=1 Tax=Thermomonospora echinospora TaxID=1992 RepID=A0A1H5YI50_9ACTN|nr:hypothetical protein [Thermomonospora echinospora]SEG23793.1 hypothetical protein SAMN04489712_10429 [Thermomonospora echinospora]
MSHADLPLPDYDHLPVATLQHRIRTLGRDDLRRLLDYEKEHAHRMSVLQVMKARLGQLDAGQEPSGGSARGSVPEHPPAAAGGSKVSPSTSGPPMNPPSHGDPTNPAQPR